jgi:hypothetical protein
MKIIINIFYYTSIVLLAVESIILVLLNGSESHLINFRNQESVILLLISTMFFIALLFQIYKCLRKYSLWLSVLALLGLVFLNLNIKLSSDGYLYLAWILLVLAINIYLIKKKVMGQNS